MDLNFRLREKSDEKFISNLFFEHKVAEINASAWPEEMKLQLVDIQFMAFEKSIALKYLNLEDKIISLNSNRVGRIVLNKSISEINIIYLSILSKYQGRGIGKEVLRQLFDESEHEKKAIILKVTKENPAYKLYLNLGFRIIDKDAIKYTMSYLK